jgi:hypothetical protein
MVPLSEPKTPDADRNRKGGRDPLVGEGVGDVAMAANALSFLVGVVLPLSGVLWLILH